MTRKIWPASSKLIAVSWLSLATPRHLGFNIVCLILARVTLHPKDLCQKVSHLGGVTQLFVFTLEI